MNGFIFLSVLAKSQDAFCCIKIYNPEFSGLLHLLLSVIGNGRKLAFIFCKLYNKATIFAVFAFHVDLLSQPIHYRMADVKTESHA